MIHGEWTTALGTKGSFTLVVAPKFSSPVGVPKLNPKLANEQPSIRPLITTTINLGAVRIDQEGLTNLVEIIKEGTAVTTPAVNATHRGREYIHLGVSSLLEEPALPGYVETLIVSASEPADKLGFKTVVVRLIKDGQNTIYVSGYDRVWVEGKARQVEMLLMNYQSRTIGFWRKYGGNANAIVFLILLGILPSVPSIADRLRVIAVTYVLLIVLKFTWTKAVNTRVFLHEKIVPAHIRYAEYIVTPLAVIFSAIVAFLIQRYVHPH